MQDTVRQDYIGDARKLFRRVKSSFLFDALFDAQFDSLLTHHSAGSSDSPPLTRLPCVSREDVAL